MGKQEEKEGKNMVDLTGHWFVNFGVETPEVQMEGSRVLTLTGGFDPDTLIDVLADSIQKSLPQEAKDALAATKQRLIIRAFNRI